jgi:cold shock CspA family protein
MPTGKVLFWRDRKGYGRILGDDDEAFFVHFSGIALRSADEYRTLQEGQRVG